MKGNERNRSCRPTTHELNPLSSLRESLWRQQRPRPVGPREAVVTTSKKTCLRANNPLSSAAPRGILDSKGIWAGFSFVTDQRNTRVPQFFLTPGGPCPYLPGKIERKVFARLGGNLAQPLSEALTHSGFRRSQSIAYRPACEGCNACVSVRIRCGDFAGFSEDEIEKQTHISRFGKCDSNTIQLFQLARGLGGAERCALVTQCARFLVYIHR